jgi:hypothetical protein
MKKGLIIGKGWIGSKLERYIKNDYTLLTTKREADSDNCISIDFDRPVETLENPNSFQFIVITIPFGRRNTKEELQQRFHHLIHFLYDYQGQLILLSSTGIYPTLEQNITESTFSNTDLIDTYFTIEELVRSYFPQVVVLRLGGIMGKDRYLSKYLDLNRDNLDERVNHVHYEDIIHVIKTCIEQEVKSEIYNVVASQHPTKRMILEYQINQNKMESDLKKVKSFHPIN